MQIGDDLVEYASKLGPDVIREVVKIVASIVGTPEGERLEKARRLAMSAAAGVAAEEAAKKALGRDKL